MNGGSVAVPDAGLWAVLGRMADACFELDRGWRITHAKALRGIFSGQQSPTISPPPRHEGRSLVELVLTVTGAGVYDQSERVMTTQTQVSFESHYQPLETRVDVRAFPSESGLSVYLRAVTERRRVEQQQAASLQALRRPPALASDTELVQRTG